MKIGIDTSALSSAHQYRGLGFYTKRLLAAFPPSLNLIEFTDDPPDNVDLIHYPGFTLFTLPPCSVKTPYVVTVHDLIPLKYPQHFPLGLKARAFWLLQKHFLKKAAAIITDSLVSKKDLQTLAGLAMEKIDVIYLAADPAFKPIKDKQLLTAVKTKYALPEKFILYVGDLNWNKNLNRLTQACLNLNYKLVVVGQQAANPPLNLDHPELKAMAAFQQSVKANPKKILPLGFLPTADLASVFNLATCYAQPSLAEGFGLPILEAFACGCPVITSKNTSLSEISGSAAILVDPENQLELKHALKSYYQQPALREHYLKLGLNQVKKYSWKKTALQTLKVYEKIID